jgi:hypothetical protein
MEKSNREFTLALIPIPTPIGLTIKLSLVVGWTFNPIAGITGIHSDLES